MVIINEESKKRYKRDNEELDALGITFEEYKDLVDKGIEWLSAIENHVENTIALEAFQKPSLGYLIGASITSIIGSIQYGYYLLTGVMPIDMDVNIPEEQYKEQRKTLLLMMKKDLLQK